MSDNRVRTTEPAPEHPDHLDPIEADRRADLHREEVTVRDRSPWLPAVLTLVAIAALGLILFFALGGDADVDGTGGDVDIEAPTVDADVDAPDIDVEAPDVDVDPGNVDVEPGDAEADAGE